ncbi:MAG: LysR family transcriptional regulator [Hyphomicrobium sp.]|nr:LysR family transcriptional regulator [Hyphomicrobium sp.]
MSSPRITSPRDPNVTAISDLDIFARVARTGNMSMAGREMGLSPAVVSKRISLLEDRLGARLFQRTTRQLTLTETGEGYFKRVVDILSLVEEAEDYVSRRNTKPRGTLKISAPTSFSRLHITPHLPAFLARYPDIEIDMQLTDNFVDIIREGFDLAVRIGELEDSSLVARKLAKESRVICASPKYLAAAGTPKTIEDLDAHNCLLAGAQDMWRLDGPDGPIEVRVKGNIRSNSADFIRTALTQGLGLALRATWDIGAELERGELQIVLPEYTGSSKNGIFAVYPCREFMPSKVNTFIEFFGDLLERDPAWSKANAPPQLVAAAAAKARKSAPK